MLTLYANNSRCGGHFLIRTFSFTTIKNKAEEWGWTPSPKLESWSCNLVCCSELGPLCVLHSTKKKVMVTHFRCESLDNIHFILIQNGNIFNKFQSIMDYTEILKFPYYFQTCLSTSSKISAHWHRCSSSLCQLFNILFCFQSCNIIFYMKAIFLLRRYLDYFSSGKS